ncbi:hypothetical protein PGT21_034148 [Puccinia graminis f. sp. tritici]|uniref:Uncharacterized protein n=1 Tax=Puccinia graminis f. sp. tritici TaxID=56615 RepID=A0A5B0M851_PUCGR|nr:hypothetical protein PGT21_034148 [Puccinia graminis f. sp. tritici]KAA1120326.1 hypothetical protein PGTUg99_014052 [Puccinia graminis f. sp. tritici]
MSIFITSYLLVWSQHFCVCLVIQTGLDVTNCKLGAHPHDLSWSGEVFAGSACALHINLSG